MAKQKKQKKQEKELLKSFALFFDNGEWWFEKRDEEPFPARFFFDKYFIPRTEFWNNTWHANYCYLNYMENCTYETVDLIKIWLRMIIDDLGTTLWRMESDPKLKDQVEKDFYERFM